MKEELNENYTLNCDSYNFIGYIGGSSLFPNRSDQFETLENNSR